jgi:predicted nucleic acid-binding Zn ribbon protein
MQGDPCGRVAKLCAKQNQATKGSDFMEMLQQFAFLIRAKAVMTGMTAKPDPSRLFVDARHIVATDPAFEPVLKNVGNRADIFVPHRDAERTRNPITGAKFRPQMHAKLINVVGCGYCMKMRSPARCVTIIFMLAKGVIRHANCPSRTTVLQVHLEAPFMINDVEID